MGTIETDHLYCPQNQLINVLDAFNGLLDLDSLPDYHQPIPEAYSVAARLIDLTRLDEPVARVVFCSKEHASYVKVSGSHWGTVAVTGPADLQEIVGDDKGPSSLLWNRGIVKKAIGDFGWQNERQVIERMYQLR